jgi:autoinducer 2-degrading protein
VAGNVVIMVDFEVKDGMLDQFLPLMTANARNTVEKEPGCSQFDVLTVDGKPNNLVLYEIYDDEAAYQAHRTMPHVAEFLSKARPMLANQKMTKLLMTAANAKSANAKS